MYFSLLPLDMVGPEVSKLGPGALTTLCTGAAAARLGRLGEIPLALAKLCTGAATARLGEIPLLANRCTGAAGPTATLADWPPTDVRKEPLGVADALEGALDRRAALFIASIRAFTESDRDSLPPGAATREVWGPDLGGPQEEAARAPRGTGAVNDWLLSGPADPMRYLAEPVLKADMLCDRVMAVDTITFWALRERGNELKDELLETPSPTPVL